MLRKCLKGNDWEIVKRIALFGFFYVSFLRFWYWKTDSIIGYFNELRRVNCISKFPKSREGNDKI